jgi:hypothetical protein
MRPDYTDADEAKDASKTPVERRGLLHSRKA